jgi:hypothetical protein
MGDRVFDIVINNIPARILFSEVGKDMMAELKPALDTLFAEKQLKEAVEFVAGRPVVKVLTKAEFKKKRKSYNPKGEVYDMLDDFVRRTKTGQKDTLTWWVSGVNLAASLPALRALFGGAEVTVRFVREGDLEGVSEKELRETAKQLLGEEEEAEPEEVPPPPPAPIAKGPECDAILREAGITSRREFTRWALRNHPDKGGDTATFQRVSACVDTQYGSARKTRRRQKKRRATRKRSSSGRA